MADRLCPTPSQWGRPRNPNNLAFTAAPYLIKPTGQDQTVTVQLQVKDGADWKP